MDKLIIENLEVYTSQIERGWHTAYLGVGSNMGDRIVNIRSSKKMIDESESCRVTNVSKVYETEPYGYQDQDKFLNCVFEVSTLFAPKELIRFLLGIEDTLKRIRMVPLGPRTIDLDILFYDDLITSDEEVLIPHPRLHERMFVLVPLCDIAPYYVHPVLNERCYRITEKMRGSQDEPVKWNEGV